MKLEAADLKRLRWPLAFLIAMIVIGGGSVWAVQQLKKEAERASREAATARRDMQTRLARANDEQQELRDKIASFQALRSRGYVGPEQRLDWIETLARIKAARKVLKLDYEFAPQRPLDAGLLPGGAAAGGFEIVSSQMRLQLQLLHEGELLAFLADLRDAAQAIVRVRSCGIERLPPAGAGRGNLAQLKAECTLEWITLREAK